MQMIRLASTFERLSDDKALSLSIFYVYLIPQLKHIQQFSCSATTLLLGFLLDAPTFVYLHSRGRVVSSEFV